MKKILTFAACAITAVAVQAAQIGWAVTTGDTKYANDAYQVFVIGQNGVTSIKQITDMLDAGSDVSTFAFGSGALGSNGAASVTPAKSGKTITPAADDYPVTLTSFAVVYDAASPTSGTSKYVLVSGITSQTKVLNNSSSSTASLATGNASSIISNANNWKSYGVPEPTSIALIALGLAAIGLKRKVA